MFRRAVTSRRCGVPVYNSRGATTTTSRSLVSGSTLSLETNSALRRKARKLGVHPTRLLFAGEHIDTGGPPEQSRGGRSSRKLRDHVDAFDYATPTQPSRSRSGGAEKDLLDLDDDAPRRPSKKDRGKERYRLQGFDPAAEASMLMPQTNLLQELHQQQLESRQQRAAKRLRLQEKERAARARALPEIGAAGGNWKCDELRREEVRRASNDRAAGARTGDGAAGLGPHHAALRRRPHDHQQEVEVPVGDRRADVRGGHQLQREHSSRQATHKDVGNVTREASSGTAEQIQFHDAHYPDSAQSQSPAPATARTAGGMSPSASSAISRPPGRLPTKPEASRSGLSSSSPWSAAPLEELPKQPLGRTLSFRRFRTCVVLL